jgi:hypothetical protein
MKMERGGAASRQAANTLWLTAGNRRVAIGPLDWLAGSGFTIKLHKRRRDNEHHFGNL